MTDIFKENNVELVLLKMALEATLRDHRSGLTVVSSLFAVPSRRELMTLYSALFGKASRAALAVNKVGIVFADLKGDEIVTVREHLNEGLDVYGHVIRQVELFSGLYPSEREIADEEYLDLTFGIDYRRKRRNWRGHIPMTLRIMDQQYAAVDALIPQGGPKEDVAPHKSVRKTASLTDVCNFLVNQFSVGDFLAQSYQAA